MNNNLELLFKVIEDEFKAGGIDHEIGRAIQQKLRKTIGQGRDNFLKSITQSYLKKKYDSEELGPNWKILKDDMERVSLKCATKKANQRNQLFIWLTINPRPNVSLEDFHKILEKFVHRTLFKQYVYVIEQRGTLEELNIGKGFHAHLLLQRTLNYKPNKVLLYSKNTFKYMCDVEYKNLFNFHWCPAVWVDDKLEYMRFGKKTAEGKLEKQEADILFRQEHELEEIYGNEWKKNIDL